MVARLAARIGKLERAIRPAEPGCDRCRGQVTIHDRHIAHAIVNGERRAACGFCGAPFTRTIKVLVGVDPEAL